MLKRPRLDAVQTAKRFTWKVLDRRARRRVDRCGPMTVLGLRISRIHGGTIEVGNACHLQGQIITHRPDSRVVIGSRCMINARTVIEAYESVTIGDDALIAFDVVITDCQHHSLNWAERIGDVDRWRATGSGNPTFMRGTPITIEDGVWVGARSIILPGVRIGRGSTVGAGSVVTRDVEPFTVVAGNPARVVKRLQPADSTTRQPGT